MGFLISGFVGQIECTKYNPIFCLDNGENLSEHNFLFYGKCRKLIINGQDL